MSVSDNQAGIPVSISAQFTLYFDGRFWVGVLEHHERHRGGDMIGQEITVRAVRYVFGAEPTDVELYDFLLARSGELIDRAAESPAVPASRSVGSSSRRPNPKRAARQAAKEAARARPSTAAQAALAATREETAARASRDRSRRRRQEADDAWGRRRQRAKRRHRGR